MNHKERWWSVVKPLMEPIETRQKDEFWAKMEEIFYFEQRKFKMNF